MTFPILSLFNILRFPLVVLPKAMRAGSEALSACERIQAFLLTEVPERKAMSNTPGVRLVSTVTLNCAWQVAVMPGAALLLCVELLL